MKRFSFRHRRSQHHASLQFAFNEQPQVTGHSASLERLEPRMMLVADVVISEAMVRNSTGLLDYYGDGSDWLEIHNRGLPRVDLKGWHFSNDSQNLTQ